MRGQGERGLTLVEMLIAMAIMGVVLVLVTNWQVSTLSISTRTNAMSQRLSDLTDVTGYVGDRVRSALRVRVAQSGSGIKINGSDCTDDNPCLLVVLPENTDTGVITKYNLYVYRIAPRSDVNADFKVTDEWAEDAVVILNEYRSEDSGSSPANCVPNTSTTPPKTFETDTSSACTAMRNITSTGSHTLSSFGKYLVSDYLTPADELGSGTVPFQYDATNKTMTLRFQSKYQLRGVPQLLPATPYTLKVQARNVQ
ncbi:type II secretion system protein [Deinococcus sp. MIMF12]|uniref:Type II secretion system protein n=1 Tax=Deinococcus rhizophilus TaxID=3049544 RepID=A0ABT7JG49_9DEIO|nr:type II secretion system protein [Deinococcus rhizophilus]MDL2344039.1 type II secretion system protein [Deinococcus rhizophilus]